MSESEKDEFDPFDFLPDPETPSSSSKPSKFPASRSLREALDHVSSQLSDQEMSGISTFKEGFLERSGIIDEIDENEHGEVTVFVPENKYFERAKGRRRDGFATRTATPAEVKSIDSTTPNEAYLKAVSQMHVTEGIDDIEGVVEGEGDSDHDLEHRTAPSLYQQSSDDESRESRVILTVKGPRTKTRQFAVSSGKSSQGGGSLPMEDFELAIVEAQTETRVPDQYESTHKTFSRATVRYVEPFKNGHVVVIDRVLRKP